jgi:SAM-dependent methyltransferase
MSQAAEVLTPAGTELLSRLRGVEVTPETALRLAEELRGQYPPSLVAAALTQQSLRIAARDKFSRAGEMFFTRAGLEQASPEIAARHSALRFAGLDLIADLCCGIGGDLIALAGEARSVLAVDSDPEALAFARRNGAVHNAAARIIFVCGDVRDLALGAESGAVQAVFIDPARRAGGRRLRTGESQPPLDWCLTLSEQVPRVCIKAAPGLARDLIPPGWETEFVAIGRDLKEALLWSPGFATAQRRATVLSRATVPGGATGPASGPDGSGGETLVSEPGAKVPVADPGQYLLDPNPAVTRAGLVAELGQRIGAWQIDPMIAFLSLDQVVSTPFARTLRVLESMPWHERQVAKRLRDLGIGSADLRRRGLAGDVEQIRHRLGLAGDRAATIVLTRRLDRPWCLICEAVPAAGSSTS